MSKPATKSNSNLGVPVQLLYEAEGLKVTVETKRGDIYRGLLAKAEDTMNLTLSDVLFTARNGQVKKLPSSIYLKGTSVRFLALPDLLKNAPLFQAPLQQKRKLEQAAAEKRGQGGSASKKRKTTA